MNLSGLLSQIEGAPSLARLRQMLGRGPLRLPIALPDSAKAAVLAALARAGDGPLLAVVAREDRAEALVEEVCAWLGGTLPVVPFPQRDVLPYERLAPDPEAVRQRLTAISLLADGDRRVVVASAMALAQRTLSPQELADPTRVLRPGSRLDPDRFLAQLAALGYAIEPLVERAGQASRRGGIIGGLPPPARGPGRAGPGGG